MAKGLVGALRVTLGLDSAAFVAGVNRAKGSSAGLKRNLVAIGVAGAAMATALAGVTGAISRALNRADDMGKMAQKFGLPVEALSRLKYAADLSDVSLETLGTSLGQLSKKMVAAAEGGKAQSAMFADMGVEVVDATGKLRDTELVLQDVAGVFAGMPDGPQKTALAMELFGKAGAAMIPLLNSGKTGLQAMAEEANKLGIVIDEKTAKSAETFNDNLTRLSAAAGGLVTQLAAALAPMLEKLSDFAISLAQSFSDLSPDTKELIASFIGIAAPVAAAAFAFGLLALAVSPLSITIGLIAGAALLIYENWDGIAAWFSEMWTSIKESTGQAWDYIKEKIGGAIDWVTQKWEAFIGLLQGAIDKAKAVGKAVADALSTGKSGMNDGSGYGGMGGAMDDPAAMFGGSNSNSSGSSSSTSSSSSGYNMMAGMAEGIRSGMHLVRDAIGANNAEAAAAFLDYWQIRSPSLTAAEYGKNIGAGLAQGVTAAKGIVGQAVKGLSDTAAGAMKGIGDLGAKLGDMFAGAATNVLTGVESLSEAVGKLLQQVASMFINSAMKSLFGNIFGGLDLGIPGYATGTNSAAAGWAMVGEEGPELMRMRGGERVYDNRETRGMLSGAAEGVAQMVQVTINTFFNDELIATSLQSVPCEGAINNVIRRSGR